MVIHRHEKFFITPVPLFGSLGNDTFLWVFGGIFFVNNTGNCRKSQNMAA
jgi:hypothetical protein